MKTFLAMLVLFAAQAALWRPASGTPAKGASLAKEFPGAVNAALLGSLRPLLVHWMWWELEAAYREGRWVDTLSALETLIESDPGNLDAANYLASFLAFTIAPREASATDRFFRTMDGLEILERAERKATWNDGSSATLRSLILRAPWSGDPRLRRLFQKRRGISPTGAAVLAAKEGARLSNGDRRNQLFLAAAEHEATVEALISGRQDEALDLARSAVLNLAAARLEPTSPLPGIFSAYVQVCEAAAKSEVPRLTEALSTLTAGIESLPPPAESGTGTEDLLLLAILPSLVDFVAKGARPGRESEVLSLILAVHSMSRRIVGRRGPSSDLPNDDAAILPALRAAVGEVLRRAPELRGGVPLELQPPAEPGGR